MFEVEQFKTAGESRAGAHELLKRIVRQDQEAWGQLYDVLREPVTRALARQFDSFCQEDIDDVYQDTMVTVRIKAATYRGLTNREAVNWIHRIARNCAIDLIRERARVGPLPDFQEGGKELAAPADVYPRENEDEWIKFLAALSPQELRVYKGQMEGQKPGQIARSMGVAPARVSELSRRIRQKAAKYFNSRD